MRPGGVNRNFMIEPRLQQDRSLHRTVCFSGGCRAIHNGAHKGNDDIRLTSFPSNRNFLSNNRNYRQFNRLCTLCNNRTTTEIHRRRLNCSRLTDRWRSASDCSHASTVHIGSVRQCFFALQRTLRCSVGRGLYQANFQHFDLRSSWTFA